MPKNQMSDKLKKLINKPIGRVTMVAAIAVVLIAIAVVPGMLPKKAGNSEHKLANALTNVTKAENLTVDGAVTVVSSSMNAKFDINLGVKKASKVEGRVDADIKFPGNTMKIPLDFVGDSTKDQFYFKVSDTDAVLDNMKGSLAPFKLALSPIAVKIDSKWIFMSKDKTKKSVITPCTEQILHYVKSSKDTAGELANLIANNKAVEIVNVKSIGDASVYELSLDTSKVGETFDDFKETDLFKSFDKCDESLGEPAEGTPTGQQGANSQQPETESTINITVGSNDKVTNFEYVTKSQGAVATVKLDLGYDKVVDIEIPTENIVKFKDIQPDLSRALALLMAPQLKANKNMLAPYSQSVNPNAQ